MKNNTDVSFGCIDINTGEFEKGYIDKGEMKFKRSSLLKRMYRKIFNKEPLVVETIGAITAEMNSLFFGLREEDYAVYRRYNKWSNETKDIYCNIRGHGAVYFNIDIWEKTGKFVQR